MSYTVQRSLFKSFDIQNINIRAQKTYHCILFDMDWKKTSPIEKQQQHHKEKVSVMESKISINSYARFPTKKHFLEDES